MKPMIFSLERLTIQDTKTPPGIEIEKLSASQDPAAPVAVTGRHLMRMESVDNSESESEETGEELTTREMGISFPKRRNK